MNDFEPKRFTESSVLFALTGHVFIREDASLEYYQECLREIHDDELYKFVMGSIPESILQNLWELLESEIQDIDPILAGHICNENPVLATIKDYSDKTSYPKSKELIEEKILTNGYIEVSPIDFKSFCELAESSTKDATDNKFYK